VSEHISEELALALSALPPDDAERAAAVRHAAGCPACQALLDEGAAMLTLLDRELTPAPVSPLLEARVHAAVLGQKGVRWEHIALVLGALMSLLMVWLDQRAGALAPGLGIKCTLIELAAAVVPFAAVARAAQQGRIALQPARLALAAMGGALAGQGVLLVDCAAQGALGHTLVFHFAGVILAALLGYAGGRRMLAHRG
jgi:hypothetical protein